MPQQHPNFLSISLSLTAGVIPEISKQKKPKNQKKKTKKENKNNQHTPKLPIQQQLRISYSNYLIYGHQSIQIALCEPELIMESRILVLTNQEKEYNRPVARLLQVTSADVEDIGHVFAHSLLILLP
uniref:Tp177 n=1 Tax=Tetrahymena pyriformis TaxID=5908 RepID=Q8I7T2_TETPY|nr:Tp177 [Tetrahymena pyriformis]